MSSLLLIAGMVLVMAGVIWHELGVGERVLRSSDELAERQHRALMEGEK